MSQKPSSRRSTKPPAQPAQPSLEQQMIEAVERAETPQNLTGIFGNVEEARRQTDEELQRILNEAQNLGNASGRRRGFMIELHGIQKTGKTHDAMTAAGLTLESKIEDGVEKNPILKATEDNELYGLKLLLEEGIIPIGAPVFVLDTELKAYKLKHKFVNTGKNIYIFPIFFEHPKQKMQVDATKCLIKMAQILSMIDQKFPDRGTIVIDSITDVTGWVVKYIKNELVARNADGAELGELIRLQPSDWQVRDDLWEYILKVLQKLSANHNIIVTSREKEDWSFEKDSEGNMIGKTGIYTPRRYRELPFAMDLEIGLRYKYDGQGNPIARIGKIISNQYDDPSLDALEIVNPTVPKILAKIIPISHKVEIEAIKARRRGNAQNAQQSAKASETQS